jgi:bla regulator protein blaR1
MESMLADVTRKQESAITAMNEQLGAVQSVKFAGVGQQGWDIYEVTYAKGTLQYRLKLSGNGKIEGLMALVMP